MWDGRINKVAETGNKILIRKIMLFSEKNKIDNWGKW